MAGDVGPRGDVGAGARLAARLHAVEEVADVEVGGIAPDLLETPGEELRRLGDDVAVVARLDPPLVPFEPDGTGAEPEPLVVAEDELHAVLVRRDEALAGRLVLDRGGVVGVVGPLAEVNAVGAPLEAPAADEAAALFEVEAVEERLVVRA